MLRPAAVLRATCLLFALLLAGLPPGASIAGDPQPYDVTLHPTGDKVLDGALHDSSSLIALQKSAPVAGFALVQRAQQDVGRFITALHSFGYYKAQVTLTIAGHPLTDPALPDTIDQASTNPALPVEVTFDLGPQFHLGQIVVAGAVPESIRDTVGLTTGQPARAVDVLAAQGRLLNAVRNAGYPLAKVDLPPADVHLATDTLDVRYDVTTGPLADFGEISIVGLKTMNESFVRRRLTLHPGEPFSPAAIEAARQDLASIGTFSVVRMETAGQLDAHGRLPVTVDVTERKLHAVDVGVAYSTDFGANLTSAWHDRNLFGNAEQLNLTAGIQLGGDAERKPGYNFGAQFIKPDFLARDQSLELDLDAVKQSLLTYDQTAVTQKAAINRKLSPHWTLSVGVSGEQERIYQESVTRHYNMVGLPLSLKYDSSNSLLDPTKGIRATLSVTPTESLGNQGEEFNILQAAASTYLDLTGSGRSVVALRGLVGEIPGTNVFALPPDQRFYAGGSGTVRGFKYQTIGLHFPDNTPTGGTAVAAGTVELRQRIIGNYGVAAFVDAGQVTANGAPFTGNWRVGAGVGFRYNTPIGPIRLDVAMPLNREPGGDAFEIYIGIGQAF
jgi:translocation and assembly module TamA